MGLGKKLVLAALWAALLAFSFGCKPRVDMREAPDEAPAPGASPHAPGQFLDGSGASLEPPLVGMRAAGHAYVLIGEGHPLPCDHLAQVRVIELMAEAGSPPAVGLEMVSLDNQPVLDLFNKGYLTVDDLPSALKWDQTVGYPFEVYRPIFETAARLDLPLFALNAPWKIVSKAARSGLKGLTFQERLGLPGHIIACPKEQEASLREAFESHHFKDKNQKAAWSRFLATQALWDTTMAYRALAARVTTRRPVVILAGSGHVEHGWGIAARLAELDPQGSRLSIMPWRGGDAPDPAEADVFFSCPLPARPRLGLSFEVKGGAVVVSAVADGSLAAKSGVAVGDEIVKAQDEPVKALSDLHRAAMKAVEQGGVLRLTIMRSGGEREMDIRLVPARPAP